MALYYADNLEHNNPNLPLVDDSQLDGGMRVVADVTAKNAIPIAKRKIGGLVAWTEGTSNKLMQYIGADLTDVNWQNDVNWQSILGSDTLHAKYRDISILETEDAGWNVWAMLSTNFKPQSYHYEGTYNRIYFAVFDAHTNAIGATRPAPHDVNSTKVFYYDLDTKTFSEPTTIVHLYNTSTDYHDLPTIIVSDDGHILIFKEELEGGSHNSPVEVWRSDNVEDISAFTKITTIDKTGYDGFSYASPMKNSVSGSIFLIMRAQPSGHNEICISQSVDNGVTWKSMNNVANSADPIASCLNMAGSNLDWYFYNYTCLCSRTSGLCVFGAPNEGGPGYLSPDGTTTASRNKFLVYLYSPDGITWGNAQFQHLTNGAFSKNIVTQGMITTAELLANFVIYDASELPYKHIVMRAMCVNPYTSIPYVMYTQVERRAATENPDYIGKDNVGDFSRIAYFDINTSAWINIDISGFETSPEDAGAEKYLYNGVTPSMIVYKDGVIDIIVQQILVKSDFYSESKIIATSSEAIAGGLFNIVTTETDNFGEGLVVGDYVISNSASFTALINAQNTLSPLEARVAFKRSADNGVTWTQVREPIVLNKYGSVSPMQSLIGNMHDSGISAVFIGMQRTINGAPVYDHQDIAIIVDEVEPYVSVTPTVATVTTDAISYITYNSASSGGEVTDDGDAPYISAGVCWNTIGDPTIADSKTIDYHTIGSFSSSITGLLSETTYYVRAYVTNTAGTTYGEQLSFMTNAHVVPVAVNGYLLGGWANGGTTQVSSADIMTFSTETFAANTASNLSSSKSHLGTGITDKTTYGYISGGYNGVPMVSTDRITYSTDVTAANTVSDLPVASRQANSISDGSNYGYYLGGNTGAVTSAIQRITFSTGVFNTSANTISAARQYGATLSDGVNYGYILGGNTGLPIVTTDRITFSTGVSQANTISNISQARHSFVGAGDNQYKGFVLGGYTASTTGSVVTADKITYSTGVTQAATTANLSVAKSYHSALTSGTENGYFCGGGTSAAAYTNSTSRLVFSTEITSEYATSVLSVSRNLNASIQDFAI